MPKQKNFFKKSLSVGVFSSVLFVAGCGTADIATEQPAASEETEQTEVETTTASGDSDEPEEEEAVTEETETSSAEEESKGVPEDQAGITTDFPLGTHLAELLEYYGTPTYDEFFLGSRLVVFDEIDGYFLDDDDKASGFLIANPDVDIFGTRIGMTFEEIDAVLEKEGEVFFYQSETQDYVSLYYAGNYRITFYADTADGASQYAIVVRDK